MKKIVNHFLSPLLGSKSGRPCQWWIINGTHLTPVVCHKDLCPWRLFVADTCLIIYRVLCMLNATQLKGSGAGSRCHIASGICCHWNRLLIVPSGVPFLYYLPTNYPSLAWFIIQYILCHCVVGWRPLSRTLLFFNFAADHLGQCSRRSCECCRKDEKEAAAEEKGQSSTTHRICKFGGHWE